MRTIITGLMSIFSMYTLKAQKIDFIQYKLSNGLHVILHQDNSKPIVAVSILYHVGSKNENPGRSGFAHFFEHLMFEGSENIKRGEFFKHVQSNGGWLNAWTNKDETYYHEVLPSNQLKLALWLESERMMHAKVEKVGIETQREVVKEEKRMRVDNQSYIEASRIKIPSLVFTKHPYHHSVIGSIEDLDSASEQDYKNFYKTFYVPNNATLTISGDFDLAETKKWIKDYFGPIEKGTIEILGPNVKEDPIKEEIFSTFEDKNAQIPALMLAYRTPKKKDKDSYVLEIISNLLGNGENSRFVKNIINKAQLANSLYSYNDPMEDYGIFNVFAFPNSTISLKTLEEAIDHEIEKFKLETISQKELDKQILIIEKGLILSNQSLHSIGMNLSHYHVFNGDAGLINTLINEYKKITPEDIKRVANQYLNKNQRVRLHNLPKKS